MLIGMPVILGGRQIGRALEIGLNSDLREMTGLYIDCGLRGNRFIAAEDIELIGDVAILVRSRGRRSRPDGMRHLRRALSGDGVHIGAICGVYIADGAMNIEALELSRGYIDDLTGGRQFIRHYTASKDGREVVVEE